MFIKLNQNIVRNEGVSYDEYEFAIYLAVRMIMKDSQDEYYLSFNQIITTLLGGKDTLCSNTRNRLRDAFIHLLNCEDENKINIKVLHTLDCRNNSFYVSVSDFTLDSQKQVYTTVTFDEVHKILNLTGFNNKFNLLRYFCVLISTLEKENEVAISKLSMEYIRDKFTDISARNTQIRYNNLLSINELLYIADNGLGQIKNERYYSYTRVFGRYCDKYKIQDYARGYLEQSKKAIEYRTDVNIIRSLKQKIAHLKKDSSIYSLDQIRDIKHSAELENARCDKLISLTDSEHVKEKYKNKKIDMSLFDQFCFEEKEVSYE